MTRVSMKKADILVALVLVPICIYVFYESANWPQQALIGAPTLIPRGVSACLLLAAGILVVRALTGRSLDLEAPLVGANRWRVVFVALLTGIYAAFVAYIGFLIFTFIYLFLFGLIMGEKRWFRLLLFSIHVPIAIHLIFARILNVPLPEGWF